MTGLFTVICQWFPFVKECFHSSASFVSFVFHVNKCVSHIVIFEDAPFEENMYHGNDNTNDDDDP